LSIKDVNKIIPLFQKLGNIKIEAATEDKVAFATSNMSSVEHE